MTEAEKQELKEARTTASNLQQQVTRLQESFVLRDGRDLVKDLVEAADIHPRQKAKIVADSRTLVVIKEGALDVDATKAAVNERIKEATELLAELTNSGAVRGMGASIKESATDPAKSEANLKEALQDLGLPEGVVNIAVKGRN
jgi:DNA-directed RNA polymerase beta subunit